ncbi:RNA-directed DNA polymerase [Neolewinella lacunae]|uniref:Reverse transcriptase n=1 Tax=Neolewinella lacunae TaxID=1517758 RepID=A0A923PQF6_9BACT|nr:RNA-directed DNA polymerase [Neolewinella lacunae]MBC6995553.1 reverse transcriptase [Neolewinella lacunae]MDN3635589.1 RNA-directed DNA polymerase [Neolewinella lacunae]
MKRSGKLIPLIAEPENLRSAFVKARRGKTASADVLAFTQNLDSELLQLRQGFLGGELQHGGYRKFIIHEPKRREICAGRFRDNVLHHAILNHCHTTFERHQVFDSYACRRGKGTHAAVLRSQKFCKQHAWYLKLDVRNFFASIHHATIQGQLQRLFKDESLLAIFDQILATYSVTAGRGLPLGNLTSQYFANHYLTPVDRFIKQGLRCPAYVRYMDDMVLWHNDKAYLLDALAQVRQLIDIDLHCALKPAVLNRSSKGLPFLGYRIFPYSIRLTHASRARFARKLRRVTNDLNDEILTEKQAQRQAQSLLAFVERANTLALRKNLQKITNLYPGVPP